jgi:hypothetical protein
MNIDLAVLLCLPCILAGAGYIIHCFITLLRSICLAVAVIHSYEVGWRGLD